MNDTVTVITTFVKREADYREILAAAAQNQDNPLFQNLPTWAELVAQGKIEADGVVMLGYPKHSGFIAPSEYAALKEDGQIETLAYARRDGEDADEVEVASMSGHTITPRKDRNTDERYELQISDEDARFSRGDRVVTDIPSGVSYLVKSVACTLPRCMCDAIAIPLAPDHIAETRARIARARKRAMTITEGKVMAAVRNAANICVDISVFATPSQIKLVQTLRDWYAREIELLDKTIERLGNEVPKNTPNGGPINGSRRD
jgi:hypothetical protein